MYGFWRYRRKGIAAAWGKIGIQPCADDLEERAEQWVTIMVLDTLVEI